MANPIIELEQNIAVNEEALALGEKIKTIYSTLADEKSASTNLPITQLIVERMGHISELHELIRIHNSRLQPTMLSSYRQIGELVSISNSMLTDVNSIKKKVTDSATILNDFDANLKKKITNFYEKVTFGNTESAAKDAGIKAAIKAVEKKQEDIFDHAIDISKADPNTYQLQSIQSLISDSQSFVGHIESQEEKLTQRIEVLQQEIESLNQKKLQLKFDEEKQVLQQITNKPGSDNTPPVLVPYKDKIDEKIAAKKQASENLEAEVTKLIALESKLSLLEKYIALTSETEELADNWSSSLTKVKENIEGLNTALALDKVGANDDEEVYFRKTSKVKLHLLAKDTLALNDTTSALLDEVKGVKNDHVLIEDISGIVRKYEAQKVINNGILSFDAELSSYLKKLKDTLDKLILENVSLLKVLVNEYEASEFKNLTADVTDLKLKEDQEEVVKEIEKGKKERVNKEDELAKAALELEEAKRNFDTAKIFLV